MEKEIHPYIHHFDNSISWKYLIIGTFPPKIDCEQRENLFPYFYGNENTIWNIIKETNLYPEFAFDSLESIKAWQSMYSVGVVDVLSQCNRKTGKECSTKDSDLDIDLDEDLNASLKTYILEHLDTIDRLYFTSGSMQEGSNSAYWLFTKLMGEDGMTKISSDKFVILPSPSKAYLLSLFNRDEANFGLKQPFFKYLEDNYPEGLNVAERTFSLKPREKKGGKVTRFPNCPSYPSLYRVERYRELLPQLEF